MRRLLRWIGCAVSLAGLAAAGSGAAAPLTVCLDGAPEGFDMAQYELIATSNAAGVPLYDTLTMFAPGSAQVSPGLAESWELSDDGTVYTLHLRRGVKFHATPWFTPTREFDADDVLFSLNRMNDPKHPAHGAAKNGFVYWEGMSMRSLIRSIDKLDDRTVRITLTRPEAPFMANLAINSVGPIVSAEYGAQLLKQGRLDALNTQPIGTGPFVFRSYQKDAVIRYDAHRAYWGGAPKVDGLVLAITPDPNVRLQRLKAGECQFMVSVKAESSSAVEKDPALRLGKNVELQTTYVAVNVQHGVLGDRRLREALALAIDKRSYVQTVYARQAAAASSLLPPAMWSHDGTLADRQDVERAKQLVRESGYAGQAFTLYARIGGSADFRRAAELLQADWARIGVQVKVRLMEQGELYKRSGQGEHDLALIAWASDNGDPDNFLTPNLACAAVAGGGNKSRWCDPDFDRLLDEARRVTDVARRAALYREAQRRVYDERPVITLVNPVTFFGTSARVQGFVPSPFGYSDFRGVSVAP